MEPQRFTANASIHSAIRREMFEGREHLVIPVIALMEGVVNGVHVSAEELIASLPAWNGVPVTVNHPSVSGAHVSANSPKILEAQSIGRTFNFRMDGTKLKGETWIDIAKATTLGGKALEVLQRAEAGQPLEVSTGYFAALEGVAGVFGGKAYAARHRHMRPDHLAMLPDQAGACSWAAGCGAPRVNAAEDKGVMGKLAEMIARMAALMGLKVNSEYEKNSMALAANSEAHTQEETAVKTEKINALIACACTKFAEKDRPFLEGLAEEALDLLGVNPPAEAAPVVPPVANAVNDKLAKDELPAGMVLISNEQKAFLDKALVAEGVKKTALVESIVANAANKLDKAFLEAQTPEVLAQIADSIATVARYDGQAGFTAPVTNAAAGSLGPAPSMWDAAK